MSWNGSKVIFLYNIRMGITAQTILLPPSIVRTTEPKSVIFPNRKPITKNYFHLHVLPKRGNGKLRLGRIEKPPRIRNLISHLDTGLIISDCFPVFRSFLAGPPIIFTLRSSNLFRPKILGTPSSPDPNPPKISAIANFWSVSSEKSSTSSRWFRLFTPFPPILWSSFLI